MLMITMSISRKETEEDDFCAFVYDVSCCFILSLVLSFFGRNIPETKSRLLLFNSLSDELNCF